MKEADAAFFCGTAAEVIGWDSLDGVPFKKKWSESLGKTVQEAYKRLVVESGKPTPAPKIVIAMNES
jgi:branched-chain amino acid aminotransferase